MFLHNVCRQPGTVSSALFWFETFQLGGIIFATAGRTMLTSVCIIVCVVPPWAILTFSVFLWSTGVNNLPGATIRAYLTGSAVSFIWIRSWIARSTLASCPSDQSHTTWWGWLLPWWTYRARKAPNPATIATVIFNNCVRLFRTLLKAIWIKFIVVLYIFPEWPYLTRPDNTMKKKRHLNQGSYLFIL